MLNTKHTLAYFVSNNNLTRDNCAYIISWQKIPWSLNNIDFKGSFGDEMSVFISERDLWYRTFS